MRTSEDVGRTLDAVRKVLAKGDLVRAKAMIKRTCGPAAPAPLLRALDALAALEALDGEPGALLADVDKAARACSGETSPYRSCAMTARILARLAFADWLAGKGDVDRAARTLGEAKKMAIQYPVEGVAVVAARVEAAARRWGRAPGVKARKLRPRAKAALAKARSWKRGTVDAQELKAFAKLVKRAELKEMATSMDDYEGDAFVCDGDLVVDGDFRSADVDATFLVVRGNLVVSGLYDAPDAHTFVLVMGALHARDVITASALDVFGDLHASGVVIGDYNDGGAHVRGDLSAGLFAPTDHPFRIEGKVRAAYVLARGEPRKGETAWADLPVTRPLEVGDVVARLRRGLPVLRGLAGAGE